MNTLNQLFDLRQNNVRSLQRGFTMVEHLIYMGIFSLLLVVLMQLFTSIIDVHLESQATSSITQDGNFILSRITNDIRRSETIASPALGSSSTSIQLISSSSDYTYQLSGNDLLLLDNINSTSDKLNSGETSVTAISFRHLGDNPLGNQNSAEVTITLQSKTLRSGGRIQSETFKTTVGTRR